MRAIRLSGGIDRCSGKVEIHRNGSWGTVCDNCWNREIASMICSLLQCDSFPQNYTQFNPPLSHNHGAMYYYHCPLNSKRLRDCWEIVNNTNFCKDSRAAGVICKGSLGFQVPTTANPSVSATTAEMVTEVYRADSLLLSSLPLLALTTVSMLLLVFLTVTSVLCCHYKSRLAWLVQQSRASQSITPQRLRNSYEDSVNLTKVSFLPSQDHDSQRHHAGRNPLMRPPSLDSLRIEEASELVHGASGTFSNRNGANPSPNSFDTSSTSSEEAYKSISCHSEEQPYEEEDEEPVYSPVSPETVSSTGDDYDDVDAPGYPA